jgi:hypothetical protein
MCWPWMPPMTAANCSSVNSIAVAPAAWGSVEVLGSFHIVVCINANYLPLYPDYVDLTETTRDPCRRHGPTFHNCQKILVDSLAGQAILID